MRKYFIESFLNYEDASNWLNHHLDEMPSDQYLHEADIRFINNMWRASLMYSNLQLNMFENDY